MNPNEHEVGQDIDPIARRRDELGKWASCLGTMPSLHLVDEHWGYYLKWKMAQGVSEPIPLSLAEALTTSPQQYLAGFFEFWLEIQSSYLRAAKALGDRNSA